MNSSGKLLTVLLGTLVIVTLLAFLALSGVAATFAWMAGGGYGSGPSICQLVIPGAIPSTSALTTTSGGNSSPCVPASQIGGQVVAAALYVNPACGGHISFPDCYYTWYKEPGNTYPPGMSTFPQLVIQYGA